MKTVKLKNISINNRGYYGIGAPAVDYDENKYTYLRITDINDDGSLNKSGLMSVDDENSDQFLLQENDIVFARTGASTGRNYFYDGEINNLVYAGFLIKFSLNPKLVNPRFIKYYCLSQKYNDWISSSLTGSTRPNINEKQLSDMPIDLPERNYQDKIVKILDSITSRIKLNIEINSNLFELMKRTYTEWFKKYNIPNEEFELKDSVLGKIPVKWNVKHLKDIFFFQEGPGIRNWQYVDKNGTKFINIRCIKDNDLELETANMISNDEAYGKYKHFMLKEWDVVVSTSGTLGRNQIIRKEHLPLCLNTSVIRFKPINGFDEFAFMYNYLISDEFLNLLDIMATGSAQRNFGPMHLNKIDLIYPNKDIIIKFNNLIFPIIKKIQNNKAENMKLTQLRDTLLPKLMNGEIDLDSIEI